MRNLTINHLKGTLKTTYRIAAGMFLFLFISNPAFSVPPTIDVDIPTDVSFNSNQQAIFEIDASRSFDPDGGAITRIWWLQNTPVQRTLCDHCDSVFTATLLPPSAIISSVPLEYSLSVLMVDEQGESAFSSPSFIVTVHPHVPTPPNVDPGPNRVIHDFDRNGTELVTLDGSNTTDDETIVSYLWQLLAPGGPDGDLGTTAVVNDVELPIGIHNILLTVTDNEDLDGTDFVEIKVNDPPVARALHDDISIVGVGETTVPVNLRGNQSTDNESIVDYKWESEGTLIAPQGTDPNAVVNLTVGIHTITLTVTDNDGATDSDTITIEVQGSGGGTGSITPEESINYIHPGNPGPAEIVYNMTSPGSARITIYDERSNLVKEIANTFHGTPNRYSATWDCRNDSGESVVSGIYHVLLELAGSLQRQTIVVVK